MKKIIFHIGGPKTGTSIIQSHLAQNRESLRDLGFLYPITISSNPSLYRTYESHHLLTYSLARWKPFSEFCPVEFFERADRTASEFGLHTLLLSAENTYWLPKQIVAREKPEEEAFWREKSEYVGRIAEVFEGRETEIVIYLRRQDRWIESWYNQQVKNGNPLGSNMLDFVNHHHYLLDYRRLLDTWAGHFGKANIRVRAYEKEQLPDGLFADFCQTAGLGDPGQFPLHHKARYNAQLSRDALEFLNLCNHLPMEGEERYWLRILIRKITNQFESQKVFSQQGFLSPQERTEVLERYEEDNSFIASQYRGDEDGSLFREDWPDPDEEWTPYPGLPAEVAVQMLMQILFEVRREAQGKAKTRKRGSIAKWIRGGLASSNATSNLYRAMRAKLDQRYWDQHCWDYETP